MKGWIANTHSEWFDFLATERSRPEVNFWNPSDYYAFRGQPGSPFFFRLKSPRNAIGGLALSPVLRDFRNGLLGNHSARQMERRLSSKCRVGSTKFEHITV